MNCDRPCGCKGIRTCLLCEAENNIPTKSSRSEETTENIYTFCPFCNMCWPDKDDEAPVYLGKMILLETFVTEKEECDIIYNIDRIPWMPSQSGRRKQDFGPKVNFKKKKVKIGEFKGFPKFTDDIIQRIQNIPELGDFQPVELCHLEYSPERGSSIDPHVDDFWLWGERLVTVNLGSSTVLTLTPCADNSCKCNEELNNFVRRDYKGNKPADEYHSCEHKFRTLCIGENSSKTNINETTIYKDDSSKNAYLTQNSEENNCEDRHVKLILHDSLSKCADIPLSGANYFNGSCTVTERRLETICNLFRIGTCESKPSVRVILPPRSLFVLSGCARYNWTHEINRQDVKSRRLAMTFRELTPEFLDGGKEYELGKELLSTADNFIDL